MRKNMGSVDKALRFLIAIGIGVLYFTNVISGTLALILLVFAVVFIGTSLLGACPLYMPFGISSRTKSRT